MLMAFEQQDNRVLADEILRLGITQDEVDVKRLTRDLDKVMRTYYDMPACAVNMGQLLMKVMNVSAQNKVRLPVAFTVMGKVLANIDGICRQLDPDYNFTEIARSYVDRAMKSELRSANTLTEFYHALVTSRNFLFALPDNLEQLMRKAVEGTVRIEFKHLGLEEASSTWRNSANRISIALIVSGSIIGSWVIVAAGKGTKSWFGLPTLGILGYVVATIFGIWLIMSIIRSGEGSHTIGG